MLTRCPNPQCKLTFELPDDREGKNAPCPQCGQLITVRSLAVLNEIERRDQQRQQRGPKVSGTDAIAPFSALLEDLRSLWNVGSIFRSADGAGFGKLYLCGITASPPRKEIAKTSLGAEENVAWEYRSGVLEVLPALIECGVQIVAMEQNGKSEDLSVALARGVIKPPLCLMVGNEVAGLSAEALAKADVTCHLPMRGIKTSLNVAVAFGIAAYQIRERLSVG